MKFKNNLFALPLLAIFGMSTPVLANTHGAIPLEVGNAQEVTEEVGTVETISSINGTIIDIFEFETDENMMVVETEEGNIYHITLSGNIAFIKDSEIADLNDIQEGQRITVYYDNTKAMPAIYPTRIAPSALVVSSERSNASVHVGKFAYSDLFGGQLLSADRSLRFEVTENTVVVDTNNEAYNGSLSGKNLVVIYSAVSRSMPAIPLNPKIIVLEDSRALNSQLFSSHTGVAAGVSRGEETDFGRSQDTVILHIEENELFHFTVSDQTMIVKNGQLVDFDAINEGDELNIVFESMQIIPMIFPPRLVASAIVINDEDNFVTTHVDVFSESLNFAGQLESHDGSLRFEITDETVIVDINNNVYTGSLENKKLGLIFSASTLSIPAMPINPTIVVLGDAIDIASVDDLALVRPMPESDLINMIELLPEFARGSSTLSYTIPF